MLRFIKDQSGATAVEYGLIAAFMAAGIIAAFPPLSTQIGTMFENLGAAFPSF